MRQRRITSRGIVQQYLDRIAKYEERLNAIITLNPRALDEADARDRERAQGSVRGPLHGIPIALKDNIHTTDMPTTGGALAFEGFVPPYEATLTKNLRDAGAIIIAKTNMTELANWVGDRRCRATTTRSRGYGFNPYDPRPRSARRHDRRASGAEHRRVELGRRHGGEFLGRQRRHRDVGLDPEPGQPDHARRHQADGRAASAATASFRSRPIRTRRARWRGRSPMRRSCSACSKARAPDPHDAATRRCPPPPGRDYTRVPASRRPARARASASRARSSTIRHPPATDRAAARSDRRGDGRGDRASEAAGRGHRRSGRHPERVAADPTTTCSLDVCSGPATRQGRELFDRLQVRHEARLQRVAGVAGAVRAGQDADRAAPVEPRAPKPTARSSMARRSSTSPTRWISSATARATRPTARKTCG